MKSYAQSKFPVYAFQRFIKYDLEDDRKNSDLKSKKKKTVEIFNTREQHFN